MRHYLVIVGLGLLALAMSPLRAQEDEAFLPELAVITPENADQIDQLAMLGMGDLEDVAWSPDGSVIAVASSLGVWLLDSATLAPLQFFETFAQMNRMLFSPAGDLLLGQGRDSFSFRPFAFLWDVPTRAERFSDVWMGDTSLVFSPDGTQLGSWYRDPSDHSYTVYEWTLDSTRQSGHYEQPYPVSALAYQADDALLAAGVTDETIKIWNARTWAEILTIPQVGLWMGFNADAGLFFFYGDDNILRVWNIGEQEEQVAIPIDTGIYDISGARVSSDNWLLCRFAFEPNDSRVAVTMSVFFSSTADLTPGEVAFTGIYDLNTGAEITSFILEADRITGIAFAPDANRIVTVGRMGVRLLDVATGEPIAFLPGYPAVMVGRLDFSPDGTLLASGIHGYDVFEDDALRVWDMTTGDERFYQRGDGEGVRDLAYSPIGDQLAIATGAGRTTHPRDLPIIRLYDPENWEIRRELYTGRVTNVIEYSPDGALLASAGIDCLPANQCSWDVRLWDAQTGQQLAVINHNSRIIDLAFAPDGNTLYSGSWEVNGQHGLIQRWNIPEALQAGELPPEAGQIIIKSDIEVNLDITGFIAVSPNGDMLGVSANRNEYQYPYIGDTVLVLDSESGQVISTLIPPLDMIDNASGSVVSTIVETITFSPDGSLIAAGGCGCASQGICYRGEITIWDTANWEQLAALQSHHDDVYALAFSPDGTILASGGTDGTIRLWGVPVDDVDLPTP